jgi:hypothetical protein
MWHCVKVGFSKDKDNGTRIIRLRELALNYSLAILEIIRRLNFDM